MRLHNQAPRSGEEEKLKKNRTKNSKMVSDSSATLDFIEIGVGLKWEMFKMQIPKADSSNLTLADHKSTFIFAPSMLNKLRFSLLGPFFHNFGYF